MKTFGSLKYFRPIYSRSLSITDTLAHMDVLLKGIFNQC